MLAARNVTEPEAVRMHSASAAASAIACCLFALAVSAPSAQGTAPAAQPNSEGAPSMTVPPPSPTPAERGKYLADAGNCVSCHTRPGGQSFAGGLGFDTPFGMIYSTNITTDPETGIGKWTAADLRRAMHEGIAADGSHLFPAFPYPSFTKITDADVDLIYAYLKTLKPVRYTPPSNGFMFSMRWPMIFWNALFFIEGRYKRDSAQSEEWNRGAYLVEGLGHCSACHTPRNSFMAEDAKRSYAGGAIQDKVVEGKARRWSAVNLSSSKNGLGYWSVAELTRYLQTGFSPRAGSFGPMNEVIVNSLKHLTPEDVHAMAVYLKSLPPRDYTGPMVSADQAKAGAAIYKERCEKCHFASGRGGLFNGPPVAGSAIVQSDDPASLINVILYGAPTSKEIQSGAWETMHPYSDVLSNAQVAAVANYLRGSWNDRGGAVTEENVADQR